MARFIFLCLIAAAPALAACGDDTRVPVDTGTAVDSGTDAAGDTGADATADATADTLLPIPDGCVALPETCNGDDDDCDGLVDEGSARELACAVGEACNGGSCVCRSGSMCGGACVDVDTNRDHCGTCGTECPAGQVCDGATCCDPGTEPVDILFMVDNSNSMTEEQASLAAAFPSFVRALSTGDVDGDGTPDRTPVTDLQIGVVTSDMGTGGFSVPTCRDSDLGDDGVLRTEGNTAITGCVDTYPSFLSWTIGGDTLRLAADAACVATVGTGGCGFEQQLDAALKAVTPSTSRIRFSGGSTGHADGTNAGFVRPNAVLGLVIVTDEEDCSASDSGIFDPMSTNYGGDLNLRCFSYPEALHPISRYVSGLLATRSRTGDLVYAVIAGVPADTVPISGTPDYAAMLADPRMQEQVDLPDNPNRLRPSCNVPGRGLAFPPRRMVTLAQELSSRGAGTTVQSICQESYLEAILAIADRVGAQVGTSCE